MLVAVLLFGCSSKDVDITLSRTELSLFVGESRSILPYVSFSQAVSGGKIALSADSDCVTIAGTTVTAVKAGVADVKISAHGKTATIKVTVSYRAVTDFSITTENAVQTSSGGEFKTVVLTAEFDGTSNPQTEVSWRVSDGTEHSGSIFEYVPRAYGEYTVTATVGNIVKHCVVKAYRPTAVAVSHTSLSGVSAYSAVTFTAYETVNALNPRSVYDWRVNGESVCDGPTFTFTPSVGRYDITLFVNGEQKNVDGKTAVAFTTVDDYADCTVDFDDADGVYIRYADGRKVRYISIADFDGKRSTFDVTDAQYSHLFSVGAFRATEYITVCAQAPKSYRIIIGMDGDRHEFAFTQLCAEAQSYIDDKVLCRNSFISSEDEVVQYVRELYATGATSAKCYAAIDPERVEQAIAEQARLLGLTVVTTVNGSVISLDFAPYSNGPSKYETVTKSAAYAELPHIEYNGSNRRANDYVFSSDRAARSIAVRGSEELLIAISNKLRPTTQSGTVAYTTYRAAKTVLLRIIGKDYTQEQKVHAIYDWLQWVTVNASVAADGAGRFLEGVFGNSGTVRSEYVVNSEGAAKAFALLCGMEGIDCVVRRYDGYGYYNKVKLDGLWYNADVCGGKIVVAGAGTGTTDVAFTSHRGLLISDGDMARLIGATIGEECTVDDGYDAFDVTHSRYMQKYEYSGEYTDNYITESEAEYAAVRAVVFNAFGAVAVGNTRIPFVGGEVIIYNNTYGVELACDGSMTDDEVGEIVGFVNRAIDEYASTVLKATFASRRTLIADGIISAIAVSPRAVQSEG